MAEKKKTVLLVDDSSFMRKLTKRILVNNGFRIIGEAGDGVQAVEKFKSLKPDIVTLDINMDEATGLEALEQIMAHDPKAAVVIISCMLGQDIVMAEAKALGVKAFVKKPIDEEAVMEAMRIASVS